MEMFIDGSWRGAESGGRFDVRDPATGDLVGSVPDAGPADAGFALQSAARAFESWRETPAAARARLLHEAARRLRAAAPDFATTLTRELGRPLAASRTEMLRTAELFDVQAEEGQRVAARMPLGGKRGEKVLITREPVGVVVAITPFNYPVTLLAFKLGAALMAGCTLVAKPSELTPLTTLMLAALFHEAGFPPGVFNVVTGLGPALGQALVAHQIPRKIAFTGSVEAGIKIAAAAALTMKRLTLELGGQSPALVLADADIAKAAAAIARHAFANSGQFCYRVARVYAESTVYDQFIEKLAVEAAKLTVGNGLTDDCALGPLVNEKIFANSIRQIEDARAKGAAILTGGERLAGPRYDRGFFLAPTLIGDANHTMQVMTAETFGPVSGIMKVANAAEALKLANDSQYGLAAFIFSGSLARGLALAERLEAGSVWVNDIQRSHQNAPFGGVKMSGLGREKGAEGIEAYLETKTIYLSYDEGLE